MGKGILGLGIASQVRKKQLAMELWDVVDEMTERGDFDSDPGVPCLIGFLAGYYFYQKFWCPDDFAPGEVPAYLGVLLPDLREDPQLAHINYDGLLQSLKSLEDLDIAKVKARHQGHLQVFFESDEQGGGVEVVSDQSVEVLVIEFRPLAIIRLSQSRKQRLAA